MKVAYCPAHITCMFYPSDFGPAPLDRGSRGVGIKLGMGTTVRAVESYAPYVTIDGSHTYAPVSLEVMRRCGTNLRLDIVNDLPVGQGFGTSASGAIATAICASKGGTLDDVYRIAHDVELMNGTGLGDVAGISCRASQPIRLEGGYANDGRVVGSKIAFQRLTLAVLGPPVSTSKTLSDPKIKDRLREVGSKCMDEFLEEKTKEALFRTSNMFSREMGLESEEVSNAIEALERKGVRSAMCMLGNSIFIDSNEKAVRGILGDVELYSTHTTASRPQIIQKE